MPTVIERAHSDQSPLWTVIVYVDQVDWQIMHIYKQPLRHRHTYTYHSLSFCLCFSISVKDKCTYTLAFDFPFKLQRGTWSDDEDGLIWESIRKRHYPPRLPLLLLLGQRDVSVWFLCVYTSTRVCVQVLCVHVYQQFLVCRTLGSKHNLMF